MGADDDDAYLICGQFHFRINGGEVMSTPVHLQVSPRRVAIRYGDGVNHVAREGDNAVDFFVSGLMPSLRTPVASRPLPGPEESQR